MIHKTGGEGDNGMASWKFSCLNFNPYLALYEFEFTSCLKGSTVTPQHLLWLWFDLEQGALLSGEVSSP